MLKSVRYVSSLRARSGLQQLFATLPLTQRMRLFSSDFNDDERLFPDPKENDLDEKWKHLHDTKENLKPRELVNELDRFIVGQNPAKRAVAVALRNRWRRARLPEGLKEEVMPKNILMIGPTGCGKTEVARRLAKLTHAPFIKVEATKFTEIGFHGRDVDQIIRDLLRTSIDMTKARRRVKLKDQIDKAVEERIMKALIGLEGNDEATHKEFVKHLRDGHLEGQTVMIDVPIKEKDLPGIVQGKQVINLNQLNPNAKKTERKRMTIAECRPIIAEMEMDRLISDDDVTSEAIKSCENDGIVFIDEIDKICKSSADISSNADASAEGVQRDLLPLIEGTTVTSKEGNIQTDHILFIASGAFHAVSPSDLLAELQGRLPIRVELSALTEEDLYRILTEPETNLITQQIALINAEGVTLKFEEAAVKEMASVAAQVNKYVENIGARRLHTVVERIMDDISFDAPEMEKGSEITVTQQMVQEKMKDLMEKGDLQKFIL